MIIKRFFFVGILLWTVCGQLCAATPENNGFADYCFTKGDFRTAELEYQRLAFYHADSQAVCFWLYRIGICKQHLGDKTSAIKYFGLVPRNSLLIDSARLQAADCALQINKPSLALDLCDSASSPQIQLTRAYADILLKQYAQARTALLIMDSSSAYAQRGRALSQISDSLEHFRGKHYLPAALLSVIPGAGHLYTGRYGDALVSAAVVASFGAVAAYYAYFNAPVRAAAFGTITGLFYAGSIYGAVISVKIYNRNATAALQEHAGRIYRQP
jgi:hypothetical protein